MCYDRSREWEARGLGPHEWPLRAGGTIPVEPIFSSRNGQMMHHAAQEGIGILLGNPDPSLLPGETPLLPVLDDIIGRELTTRCLSPLPGAASPRARAFLETVQQLVDQLAVEAAE